MNWLSHHLSAHGEALSRGDLVQLGVLIAFDVLLVFSVASVAVAIERALALSRARKVEESEYAVLRDGWRQGSPNVLQRLAQSEAPSARAVQNGVALLGDLQNPASSSSHLVSHANARELAREAVTQGLDVENARLGRNLSILATIASTAPYIGLFGTVLGILSAFARIAATGQTGASAVAGPIAEALTATGLGLGVAIPAVMAYNYLSGRVGDIMLRVETHALDLSARLIGSATPQLQPPPQVLEAGVQALSNGAGVGLGKATPNSPSSTSGGAGDAH